jgi:hypothetical protein
MGPISHLKPLSDDKAGIPRSRNNRQEVTLTIARKKQIMVQGSAFSSLKQRYHQRKPRTTVSLAKCLVK